MNNISTPTAFMALTFGIVSGNRFTMNLKDAVYLTLLLLFVAVCTTRAQGLRDTTNRADYVVLCASSNQSQADRLAQFRTSHNGFMVKVVPVESVYVDFHFPGAADSSLRSFILYATTFWSSPRPRFFVLAGNVNTIPSHKEPGLELTPDSAEDSVLVDNWFVETKASSLGTLRSSASIGRLPAWTVEQLDTIISKTIAYDQAMPGPWARRSLALADYNEEDGKIFEHGAANLQSVFSHVWPDTETVHVRASSPLYQNLNGFLSEWRQGAAVISLSGHGNPWTFSRSSYLTASDIGSLGNGTKLPICLFVACKQQFHHSDSTSIVERLLFQQGGGAVATIASSGLLYFTDGSAFFQQLASIFSSDTSLTLGEALSVTRNSSSFNYAGNITRRFTLLGDPAITPKTMRETAGIASGPAPTTGLSLAQNYPNPFNATTRLVFSIPYRARAVIEVFDVLGARIATVFDRDCDRGTYSAEFSGSGLASGMYLIRLRAGDSVKLCRAALLK